MSRGLQTILILFCIFPSTILLAGKDCPAGRSSDGVYTITTDLAGSGGGLIAGSGYLLKASIGQPAQGTIFSASQSVEAGFWFTVKQLPQQKKSNIFLLIIPATTSQDEQ